MNLKRLLEIDADLSARLRAAEEPGLLRNVAILFGHSGDSWFWLVGLLVLWMVGDAYWKGRALVMMGAILALATIVMILKFTIRRKRPEGELGQIYRKTDPHSFPSGHAARALMLGVLALILGPPWFGIVLIVWGPLVGLARVAMGVHYVSDVAVGWVIGIIAGVAVPYFLNLFIVSLF
ncbi:MAG: phosphatase PAP2 family protein [Anaerolineales bacterium]|jgi:undecaprenyl-diphosphatase